MLLNIDYKPLPFATKFHASADPAKLIVGGKGSGKTEAFLHEAFMLSMEYPGNEGLLCRETAGEVEEILVSPMLKLVPDVLISDFEKQHDKLIFTNGSVIYFKPLDAHRKMKGKNLGFAGIDELDAVKYEDWLEIYGQVRRNDVRLSRFATTNPTSIDHWIYKQWVVEPPLGYRYFKAPTKENIYLPAGFVDNLYATMPASWVRRYLEGEWGSITLGDRVYPDFAEKLHVYDHLVYHYQYPVVRVWDFGLNGQAAVFFQIRDRAGADFLNEMLRKNMTARSFAKLVARFCEENFPGAVFEDYGDIAGHHHDVTSLKSAIEEVNDELNINIQTSEIPLRDSLEFVRTMLSQNFGGSTALRFSPNCRLTIEGLNGGYVFPKNKDGSVRKDIPASDPIFEHMMDIMRYGIWHKFAFTRPESQKWEVPVEEPLFKDTSW